ncbi:MAG: hypothetical protein WB803_19165, partial [Pseudolabrys sp.]
MEAKALPSRHATRFVFACLCAQTHRRPENTAMNPTPIMPPFRGGLRLIGSSFKSLKMTAMKWAGSDVPVLRRWCAGLVYQFAEAATKFH